MSSFVFSAILLAALLHAGWNALVKGGIDRTAAMTAVVVGQGLPGLVLLPVSPFPTGPAFWLLVLGIGFHIGYQFFLVRAYRFGAFGQVYPIARGVAPLIVTLVSVTFLGVALSGAEIAGILLVACGIIALALLRQGDGLRNPSAVGAALVTGCFIAAYSLTDGRAAQITGAPLAYYAWLAVGNALIFVPLMARQDAPAVRRALTRGWPVILAGGGASFAAYALVLWAMTQAPIPLVTALRESSILFALAIGALFLREPIGPRGVFAALITLAGVATLRLA